MPDPANKPAAESSSFGTIPPSGGDWTDQDLPPHSIATAGRFQLLAEIARGGMGIVYSARDPQFGREIAVKTLSERLGDRQDAVRRFDEEARITGQLQHPGIPAVFESGLLDDGRPFLAMKLVKGRTLAGLLEGGGPNRTDLIPAFERICQAVAYAHSRHVIHRDLKPANVMVGAFGEVQVMDWGLAKVLGERQKAAPVDPDATATGGTQIHDPRSSSASSETKAGSMLGTPAYMPPEQAAGSIDQIDERADVFGLGAILCVILTGEPPYVGIDADAVRAMALRAKLEDCYARLSASGADPELVALTRRCLSPEVADRPQNAGKVAAAVSELRRQAEERARQAELERARTELRVVGERKRRRVQLALAASVLGFLLLAGGGAWWAHQQANERHLKEQVREEREKRVRDGVERVFARLPELYDRALWTQAEASLEQAIHILGEDGDAELRGRVKAAQRDTAFVRRLDEIRLGKITAKDGKEIDFAGALRKYAAAFRENGFDMDAADRANLLQRLNESPVRANLLAALDDWAFSGHGKRTQLFAITAEATGQEWRTRLPAVWHDKVQLAKVYDAIPTAERSPAVIAIVGYTLGLEHGGIRRLEDGRHQYPGDFWLHIYAGLLDSAHPEKLIGACRAALVVRPDAALVHLLMSSAMEANGDIDGQIASCRELTRLHPNYVNGRNSLGYALKKKGDFVGAIAAHEAAICLDPKNSNAYNGRGNALRSKGDRAEAAASYRKAVLLDPNFALAYNNLAILLFEMIDFPGAAAAFREAIRLDPIYKGFQPGFAFARERLAYRDRLAGVKQGSLPNSPTEAVLLANIFGQTLKKEYAIASHLFEEAFRADPKLVERNCYKAAAAAARLAAGDDPGTKPVATRKAALRAKAAEWLAADLAAVRRVASPQLPDDIRQATARLLRLQNDADFASVRDPKPLAALHSEERQRWEAFWADVRAEMAKAAPRPAQKTP